MTFKKGCVPWNKGKKGLQVAWNKGKKNIYSKETKQNISNSLKQFYKKNPEEKKKRGLVLKGKTYEEMYGKERAKFLKENHSNLAKKNPNIIKTQFKKRKHYCITNEFKKGNKPLAPFKKGYTPWNYIDGRSKFLSPARYGDDWEAIRYLVYLRDKFTCQDCFIKGISLHIHHKIPFLINFDNSLNNLVTLCPSCHRKEDARIIKELKNRRELICH